MVVLLFMKHAAFFLMNTSCVGWMKYMLYKHQSQQNQPISKLTGRIIFTVGAGTCHITDTKRLALEPSMSPIPLTPALSPFSERWPLHLHLQSRSCRLMLPPQNKMWILHSADLSWPSSWASLNKQMRKTPMFQTNCPVFINWELACKKNPNHITKWLTACHISGG